ncbi:tripartite motif-containing protein 3-like [Branchiostoma lanceolatum]|uniref:tripartite motif-containing protein 3-like n=1 Tax=Branchiostoma lanceolatum TaxID=7740 RepID=UPI003456D6D0
MAAAPTSLGDQIREELSCSICLELFTRPKMLPCQHTFCQNCLDNHAGREKSFKCPNCRLPVRLPRQGVIALPDNHLVKSLCERLQKQGATLLEEMSGQPQCSFHPPEEFKVYCKQCQISVCEQCLEEAHDDHRTTTIKKAAQERKSTIQALIANGRNILESYVSFISGLSKQEKILNKQKQQTDNSIIQAYNQAVQKLAERKEHLLSESEQNHRKNLKKIEKGRNRVLADVTLGNLNSTRHGAGRSQRQEAILTRVVGKYNEKSSPPGVETQPVVFQPRDTIVPLLGHVMVQSLPSPPTPAAPTSGTDAARGTGHHRGYQRSAILRPTNTPVPMLGHSLPSAPKPSVPASTYVAAGDTGHHSNQRQVDQSMRVTFGGKGHTTGQFKGPCGIAVSDEGLIFVADDENQRIQVFTLQGTFVHQFPTFTSAMQKMNTDDVAMDGDGNLWVVGGTDSAEFAVQYTRQGRALRNIDLQRTRWGRGVAVDTKRNHVLLTQTTGNISKPRGEVQVFRPDGTLVKTMGWQQGMKFPLYITVNREGNILVSDYYNHCIYVYNEDKQFLFQFGSERSGEGQLTNPKGICTNRSGSIIVVDWGNRRVKMFDKLGRFLRHVDINMDWPQAIVMATYGQLVVTELKNHTISIFHNY